jgi:predicted nucleotidyltransferase
MEQKYYNFKIIEQLYKSPEHIRSLARKLNTNQMTILRKLKELERINVVDFRQEGRNKVFFLKQTLEADQLILMIEHYKFLHAIKKYPLLRRIFSQIRANKRVKLAVLFGSYAKDIPRKDSDIDIYVDTLSKGIKKEIEEIDTRINVKIGKFSGESLLIREIDKAHVIIKGFERYYEHRKSDLKAEEGKKAFDS